MSIIGHMASFPARASALEAIVRTIAPQLDQLILVLNEFPSVPEWLKGYSNIRAVLPERDLKDVGKFLTEPSPDDDVFMLDDDILYPEAYVSRTLDLARNRKALFTYHGAILSPAPPIYDVTQLRRVLFRLRHGKDDPHKFREKYRFYKSLNQEVRVNLPGSGVSYMPGAIFPSFEYMDGSAGFVDLRLARWCAEQKIEIFSLPNEEGWLREAGSPESLFETVTSKKPAPFVAEMSMLRDALF